jgi:IS30 family transposase
MAELERSLIVERVRAGLRNAKATRHGGRAAYRAHEADQQAWNSALRPKKCLLATHRKLRDIVASKLFLDWSPEQINTNLLLRQYFPRGTDLSPFSQAQLDQVSLRLNQPSRETLGFETPASKPCKCCVDRLSWHR